MRKRHSDNDVIKANPVFFNLFVAAEPSASICVAHGALCNGPTLYSAKPLRTVFANFVPGQFGLFHRNLWEPLTET